MTAPNWKDIMKYDGRKPEPPYDTPFDPSSPVTHNPAGSVQKAWDNMLKHECENCGGTGDVPHTDRKCAMCDGTGFIVDEPTPPQPHGVEVGEVAKAITTDLMSRCLLNTGKSYADDVEKMERVRACVYTHLTAALASEREKWSDNEDALAYLTGEFKDLGLDGPLMFWPEAVKKLQAQLSTALHAREQAEEKLREYERVCSLERHLERDEEIDALQRAVDEARPYMKHYPSCWVSKRDGTCTCGLDAWLARNAKEGGG